MPQIKSAIKRVKTQAAANKRNAAQLSEMRTAVKKFKAASAAGADNASELHLAAVRELDKAASKGVLHKNTAARKVSKMMKKANTAKA